MTTRLQRFGLGLACLVLPNIAAHAALIGPSPYLQFSDSPFFGDPTTVLENFQDGAFNTPGATPSAGWVVLGPGEFTDSVDGDDGSVDGSGLTGFSYYSGNAQSSLTITFDPAVLGFTPTFAGLVWTDVGAVSGPTSAVGNVVFSAIDADGNSLGSIGPTTLGDGSARGGTAEDRFFGATSAVGIRSITISMNDSVDWEVDHVQFGGRVQSGVPAPTAVSLLAIGVFVAAVRRRRQAGAFR